MAASKKDWILLALNREPLDRIHLMKALFLLWKRCKQNIPDYFLFEPYLYGPCSFEVYDLLQKLLGEGLILQPLVPRQKWSKYYLTPRGAAHAKAAEKRADPVLLARLREIVDSISNLSFYALLQKVYKEAPEFTTRTVLRGAWRA